MLLAVLLWACSMACSLCQFQPDCASANSSWCAGINARVIERTSEEEQSYMVSVPCPVPCPVLQAASWLMYWPLVDALHSIMCILPLSMLGSWHTIMRLSKPCGCYMAGACGCSKASCPCRSV